MGTTLAIIDMILSFTPNASVQRIDEIESAHDAKPMNTLFRIGSLLLPKVTQFHMSAPAQVGRVAGEKAHLTRNAMDLFMTDVGCTIDSTMTFTDCRLIERSWKRRATAPRFDAEPVMSNIVRDRSSPPGPGARSGIEAGLTLSAVLVEKEAARLIRLALGCHPQPPSTAIHHRQRGQVARARAKQEDLRGATVPVIAEAG